MKKLLPVVLLVVVAGGLWFALSSREGASGPASSGSGSATSAPSPRDSFRSGMVNDISTGESGGARGGEESIDEDDEGGQDYDERSAIERYRTLEDALKALKDGAVDYDDLVLDQFTDLPPNCSWCDELYSEVRSLLTSPDVKSEQKSYYAEVLAISGRVENIKTLVEGIKNAANEDDANLYAEALEIAVGKDDVVKYLGEQLEQSSNEVLRESSVAAVTNQGSRLAVETLYEHTAKRGDPDGYYSVGIGLGEVVPESEAYPYLQQLVTKRDQYSHLAAKALFNSGLDGLKIVVDTLSSSPNAEFDKQLLEGAKDHIPYDDEVLAYLRTVSEKSNVPLLQELAKELLADAEQMDAEEGDDEDDQGEPFTPVKP